MVDAPELETLGAPDRSCGTCGHEGHVHVVREVEEPGKTVRENFCEDCDALCEFIPAPEV